MLLLGLILLGATGAFTGLLIADNLSGGPDYTVTVLGNDIATMSSLAIFLAGIALALVFCLGAALVVSGGARSRRHAAERRSAHVEARQAIAERDALQDRLDQDRLDQDRLDRSAEQRVGRQAGRATEPPSRTAAPAPVDEPASEPEPLTAPASGHPSSSEVGADAESSNRP